MSYPGFASKVRTRGLRTPPYPFEDILRGPQDERIPSPPQGLLRLVNGHNRLRILRSLNHHTVRCIIWDRDDAQTRLHLATQTACHYFFLQAWS